jgi:hypothetical protein
MTYKALEGKSFRLDIGHNPSDLNESFKSMVAPPPDRSVHKKQLALNYVATHEITSELIWHHLQACIITINHENLGFVDGNIISVHICFTFLCFF